MRALSRLAEAFDALRGRERRGAVLHGVSTTLGYIPPTSSGRGPGRVVSPATTENIPTALACVNAIGSAISALPVYVYRRVAGGREELPGHPLMRLVRNGVNTHTAWPDYIEWLVAQLLLRGNGLSGIKTDSGGNVVELEPVPWEWCAVRLLPNGRLAYDITTYNSLAGGAGRVKRLLEDEVLHLRDRTDDGIIGRSRIQRAAAAIAGALYTQDYASSLYANGAKPTGVLSFDHVLTDDQRAKMRQHFRDLREGQEDAMFVLEAGMKYQQISISPEDAELLSSRRFSTEDVARIFNVPPPLVGIWDHSSFTNSETAGRWFAQFTLSPIVKKIEAEISRSLLSEDERQSLDIVLDLSGLLRGDDAARWQNHAIAVDKEILTPNEIREQEGYNRRDGGDTFGRKGET